MDRLSDSNDNSNKNSLNWQNKQRINNNSECFVNNEKIGDNSWKTNSTTTTSNGKIEENQAGTVEDGESENGSTDNLSFSIDNDLIDDIILLPDNVISEDEVSNPDNCVYAYRGSPEPLHRHSQPQDDETDFLEMDFDPEPNSDADVSGFIDIDPSPDVALASNRHSPEFIDHKGLDIYGNSSDEITVNNLIKSPVSTTDGCFKDSHPSSRKYFGECSTSSHESSTSSSCLRNTGAIPKKPSQIKLFHSPSCNESAPSTSRGHNSFTTTNQQELTPCQYSFSPGATRHNFKHPVQRMSGAGDAVDRYFDNKSNREAIVVVDAQQITGKHCGIDKLNTTLSLIEETKKYATYSKCNNEYSYQTEDFMENFDKNDLNVCAEFYPAKVLSFQQFLFSLCRDRVHRGMRYLLICLV